MPQRIRKINSFIKGIILLWLAMLFIRQEALFAQVISNNGAVINVTNNTVVDGKDLEINTGTISNNGTVNLNGNYLNAVPGITNGNGLYFIKGNWTNNGTFTPGISVVTFNGSSNQSITHGSVGETFYILTINSPGGTVTHFGNAGSTLSILNNLNINTGTLSLGSSTSNLNVNGITAIGGTLKFDNLTTQTATLNNILSGSGTIDMSGGSLPHLLNLIGTANSIGTLTTSPTSSSTVDYKGITQTVFPSPNYRNLVISNTGIKTLQGNSIVGKDLTISSGTFDLGTTATTLGVSGNTSIIDSLRFNGTSTKAVTLSGDLSGSGIIDMSGSGLPHYLNLGGVNNSIGTYTPGSGSTVDYIRSGDQNVFTSDFYRNLQITGSGVKTLSSDISASGTLTMLSGNINSSGNILKLTNSSPGAVNHSAGIVIGKLQRAIGTIGSDYLYPVGFSNYNPLKLKFRNLTAGPLIAQFKALDIGALGLPLEDDDGNEIWDRYTEGYWSLTAITPLATTDYNVNLNSTGFTGIDTSSTIIKRTDGGPLTLDGKNGSFAIPELNRDTLTGGISTITTDFAIGKGRPKIKIQPNNIDICEGSNAFFEVKASGRGRLTYRWEVNTGTGFTTISNGGVYSDATTKKLIITAADFSMNGYLYRCIITDRAGRTNTTITVLLTVNKIPIATATPSIQTVCNSVNFIDVVLGTFNNVTGTTFVWSRNNPSGISSTVPMSGSGMNIGDIISGSFTNSTNNPLTVTFTVTPTGPATTFCVGNDITFTVTIEPTVTIAAVNDTLCNNTSTSIFPVSAQTTTNGIRYTWTVVDNPNIINESDNTGKGQNLGTAIIQSLTNTSNIAQKVTYRITPHAIDNNDNNVCSFNFIDIDVWVEPTVVITAVNDTLCNKTATNILPVSNQTTTKGIRYTWTVVDNPNISGESNSTGQGQNLGTPIVQTLTNTTQHSVVVHYTITPWTIDNNGNNKCVYASIPIDIWVDPTPFLNLSASDTAICNKTDVSFTISNNQTTTGTLVYDLDVTYPAGVTGKFVDAANQPSNAFITDSLVNNTTSIQLVRYTFKPLIRNAKQGFDCRNGIDSTVVIKVVPTLAATTVPYTYIGGNNIRCYNESNGSINLIPTGGYYPRNYTYQWSKNGVPISTPTVEDPANLNIGWYKYHIQDILGCQFEDSVLLTQPGLLRVAADSISPVFCIGSNDGEIYLKSVVGGNTAYSYYWASYDSFKRYTRDIKQLRFGEYNLTITDANGCIFKSTYKLTAPTPVIISYERSVYGDYNISCFGRDDGYINIESTGIGNPSNWTYSWFGDGGFNSTQKNINTLKAGSYFITVKDSLGCYASEAIIINQPDTISITRSGQKYQKGYDISCFGNADGIINLNLSGGHAYKPYNTFSWKFNGNPISNNTQNISGLVPGIYSVDLTDSVGCKASWSDTLVQPLKIILDTIAISNFNGYQVSCKGSSNASVDLQVSGGDGQFTYLWTTLDGKLTNNTVLDQTNLPAGTYTIKATDEISCSMSWNIQILEPDTLEINPAYFEINGYRISCRGGNNGQITLNPAGGVGPYNYLWTSSDGIGLVPNNENQSNLTKGTYIVQLTDANNCVASWNLSLNEPDTLKTSIVPKTVSCFGTNNGSADLTVQGGVPVYSYLWSTGATSQDVNSLFIGKYNVRVIDANGCVKNDSTTIKQPPVININLTAPLKWNNRTMISCYGRSDADIASTVSGGYLTQGGFYRYNWTPGGETGTEIHNVPAGKYYLKVMDDNDCSVTDSITVVEPQKLITEVYPTDPTCYGSKDGTITLIVQGGTPVYTYKWDATGHTGQLADSIGAGIYKVSITDLNGCRIDTSATLVQPDSIRIIKSIINPTCPDKYDGSIDVQAEGGTLPFTLKWSNGVVGQHLQDLGEGKYVLHLTDNQQCVFTDTTVLKGINKMCITIPTAFTPNGDGVNDTWEINEMQLYPKATVEIYNRWGERIFFNNHGYTERWDGNYKGRELPIDSYHYVIDLKNGSKVITGNVTIIK